MGLYDRDYGRDDSLTPWEQHEREQQRMMKPKSVVVILIVVTVIIFLLDTVTGTKDGDDGIRRSLLADWFATRHDTVIQPWTWFQFLTYGFLHDITKSFPSHVLFNMFGLFVFGRAVEEKIGRGEFLRFYLLSIIAGGIIGSLTFWVTGEPRGSVIGASGAVMAVTILFACYYPHQKVLLMMVFPIKAWVLAVLFVALNLLGTLKSVAAAGDVAQTSGGIAFSVHLAGAAFGGLYFYQKWNLGWFDFTRFGDRMKTSARRTKLKIHDPDAKMRQDEIEADRILAKIHQSGESSLTNKERKTLERYSKRKRETRG